jgi:hypothetical protein
MRTRVRMPPPSEASIAEPCPLLIALTVSLPFLGVSGTSGSNPLSSSRESGANPELPQWSAMLPALRWCSGTERRYGAGGEDGNFVAASNDGVPRCPSRTT